MSTDAPVCTHEGDTKRAVIGIHRGLFIVAELRPTRHVGFPGDEDVFIGVGDGKGQDQIAYVEAGPDRIVVRAMRDALTALLGEPHREEPRPEIVARPRHLFVEHATSINAACTCDPKAHHSMRCTSRVMRCHGAIAAWQRVQKGAAGG